jgi:hypothetical protein
MIRVRFLFVVAALALPAAASTIITTGSDSETAIFGGVSYRLRTTGNGSLNAGQSGFIPVSAQSLTATAIGVGYINYLALLPGGSTVTGAQLDFSGTFGNPSIATSLTSGTRFYQPAFSGVLSSLSVTISSTSASVTLAGASAVGYNLWPLFQNDILTSHPIHVAWRATDTFATLNFPTNFGCNGCTEQFSIVDTRTFVADTSANRLVITYTQPSSETPEPATLVLFGSALLALVATSRRLRRR